MSANGFTLVVLPGPIGMVLNPAAAELLREKEGSPGEFESFANFLKSQAAKVAEAAERKEKLEELLGPVTHCPTYLPAGSKNIFDCI